MKQDFFKTPNFLEQKLSGISNVFDINKSHLHFPSTEANGSLSNIVGARVRVSS